MSWEQLPVRCAPVLPGTVPVLGWLAAEGGQACVTGVGAAAAAG